MTAIFDVMIFAAPPFYRCETFRGRAKADLDRALKNYKASLRDGVESCAYLVSAQSKRDAEQMVRDINETTPFCAKLSGQ